MEFITSQEEIRLGDFLYTALYFYASWMPYHKKYLVMIDKLQKKYKQFHFLAIDTDTFPDICKRYMIESVPTVIIFKKANEKNRIIGLTMTKAFNSIFRDILPHRKESYNPE